MCYLLDLHLFLGRPFCPVFETPKTDDDIDGLFGVVPQLLLEEELGQLTSWYTSSIDVVSTILYCHVRKTCNLYNILILCIIVLD